jgi:hypothetical protein
MAQAQQGQERRPSIAEQVLQQAEQQDQGIDQLPSNLPVAQDEEMGMAGGGIVAFADRGLVEERMLRDSYNPPRPSRGRWDMPGPIGNLRQLFRESAVSEPNLEDPLASVSGVTPESLAEDESRIENIPAQEQAVERARIAKLHRQMETDRQKILRQRQAEATERLNFLRQSAPDAAATYAQENQALLNPQVIQGAQVDPKLENQMLRDSYNPPQGTQPGIDKLPSGARPSLRDVQAMAGETGAPSAAQPESAMDRYARMLEAQGDDSAKSRKDAKAMAIIQAGLGMMGGTSPNAFANIAQGAMPAIQSYQQALQGLRKDDRERIGKLMEMGLSKEKLGLELKKLGIEDRKTDALVNLYNARAGAAGAGGSKNELTEKQERELYIRANTGVTKVRADLNKAMSDATYKMNAQIANNPKAKPEQREKAQAYIDNVRNQFEPELRQAEEIRDLYRPRSMPQSGGAGTLPPGLPPGSVPIGKSGGKTVYRTPDGRQLVEE